MVGAEWGLVERGWGGVGLGHCVPLAPFRIHCSLFISGARLPPLGRRSLEKLSQSNSRVRPLESRTLNRGIKRTRATGQTGGRGREEVQCEQGRKDKEVDIRW